MSAAEYYDFSLLDMTILSLSFLAENHQSTRWRRSAFPGKVGLWAGKKIRHKERGEKKMKKLISITLLSAVAMLAAPKAQNTATTTSTKKVQTKHHVKKAKTAVKPVAATTPSK
jgi:hypothetical protein